MAYVLIAGAWRLEVRDFEDKEDTKAKDMSHFPKRVVDKIIVVFV